MIGRRRCGPGSCLHLSRGFVRLGIARIFAPVAHTRQAPSIPRRRGLSMSPRRPASPYATSTEARSNKRYIVEATGSGVAIIDYDRDGWPDIFLVNGRELPRRANGRRAAPDQPPLSQQSRRHLYRRHGEGGPRVSTAWGQGACVGDYDNDGLRRPYVTGYGKNRLFHNQGDGTFREVAEAGGVAGTRQGVGHRLRLRRL